MSERSSDYANLQATVHGRVQGVGFRQFVLYEAHRLGLTGWVRNDRTYPNRVEVEAEGPRRQLEALLERLQDGPSGAWVSDVSAQWSDATGSFKGFQVRY